MSAGSVRFGSFQSAVEISRPLTLSAALNTVYSQCQLHLKRPLSLTDSSTGDLDSRSASLVLDLLVSLNRSDGLTIAMVTHDQALKQLAHRVVHMVDGKVLRIEIIDKLKAILALY